MGFKIEQWSRRDWLISALLGLALFGVYLRSSSPAFPANDSPETISAAWELGNQHPPGYPLAALLGRFVILLLGLGSPAWRLNLLSAILGVSSAVLAGILAMQLARREKLLVYLAAFFASGLWQCGWEQATEAKGGIYLLNLVFCEFLLLGTLALRRQGSARAARLFWLCAGLSLANHYMSALVFLLPCALWLSWRRPLLWKETAWILPGLSLYLYLPLRAHFEPFNNFGNPSTWSGFLWVLLRRGYSQAGLSSDWSIAADQMRLWAIHSLSYGAYWVLPLALWGLRWLWRRQREETSFLILLYSFFFVSVVLINRTLPDVRWLTDIFMLPGQVLVSLAAGLGMAAVEEIFRWPYALGSALALAASLSLGLEFRTLDRSQDFSAYDYGHNLMEALPKGALYLADGDYHYMPLVYAQVVEGKRPDLEILISSLLDQNSYQERLQRRRGLRVDAPSVMGALKELLGKAPLFVSSYHPYFDAKDLAPWRFWQRGLVQELSVQGASDPRMAQAWALRPDWRDPMEALDQNLWPWYTVCLVNMGNSLSDGKNFGAAAEAYSLAVAMPGTKPLAQILYNWGFALEASGQKSQAIQTLERSLLVDPGLQASRNELDRLGSEADPWKPKLAEADEDAKGKDPAKARAIYEDAIRHGVVNPAIYRDLGILKYELKDYPGAEDCFQKGNHLDPTNATLYEYQVMAMQNYASRDALRAVLKEGIARSGDPALKEMLSKVTP